MELPFRYKRFDQVHEGGPLTRSWRAILLLAAAIITPTASFAHSSKEGGAASGQAVGIEIASISHSDMQLVAPYYSSILALAGRQTATDERFRRIFNFTKIQNTFCLWGLVPGGVSDEESAFNPCSHAYLAGAMALLEEMKGNAASTNEAQGIFRSIETDRKNSPLLVLCESSAEKFHTAEILKPIGTRAALGGMAFVVSAGMTVGAAWMVRKRLRSDSRA